MEKCKIIILINPGTPDEKLVRFTNVPLSVVHEAIAHINDNSDVPAEPESRWIGPGHDPDGNQY